MPAELVRYGAGMAEPQLARDLLPEDSYDAGDPLGVRLDTVERVVLSVLADTDAASRATRRPVALRLLDKIGEELLTLMDRVTAARARMEGGN
jgi:hypothetical protein